MDEIIIRFLQGKITGSEERELLRWREASLMNERHFREISRLWSLTRSAEAFASPGSSPSAQNIINAAERSNSATTDRPPRKVWVARGLAAAAMILIGLGIARIWSMHQGGSSFGAAEFITGESEMVTARLSDGSIVRLAPESRLSFRGTAEGREVWLDGHAFFAVAKVEGRPFTVRTRAGDALVLGTRFDVRVEENAMQVVVVEGRVALSAGGEEVEVGAGELSKVVDGSGPTVETVGKVQPMVEWVGELLVFQSTPLHEVAREIEARYGMRVDLPDSTLANRTVTAWFTDQSAEEVLTVVCRVVDAHCSIRDSIASIEP